jgi:threonine synthase
MELWHGPTAAFKDVALQIMPLFLATAKKKVGETAHTVVLVATSGDTGKAALEGFKDSKGISIIVFYPHGGVSEIQRLQMATTDATNTHVIAVRGNFDDCQTGVKRLFGDDSLKEALSNHRIVFSSANSINWGRLCPQIVYYYYSYLALAARGELSIGDPVDFCVPTGNFGNILAGYYARRMGLPVRRLLCASNRNKILTDFFETGAYDRNRQFYRTLSPSMDILISSNLERFLFEMTGHDGTAVARLNEQLGRTGRFEIDEAIRAAMAEVVVPEWIDEQRVLETIRKTYEDHRYVLDTHTAVGVAVSHDKGDEGVCTIIDSTASPYKFSRDVVRGITGETVSSELQSIERLHQLSGLPVHRAVDGLRDKPVRHDGVIDIDGMRDALLHILDASS